MADFDEDIFDDLYDDEPKPTSAPAAVPAPAPAPKPEPEAAPPIVKSEPASEPAQDASMADQSQSAPTYGNMQADENGDASYGNGQWQQQGNGNSGNGQGGDDGYGPINVKEDGKMFIGGLNWETTEDSLKSYFSQYGEVSECTVMRDSATGRSRGFGFLTFRDPKCVNIVMVKEHYLDGKIIDPKRAIPREEQERTSKIFVGGVSQEATEQDFKNFFKSFGRVVDATLMMDKDTGRPRGFGFVTFDGDAAVDACLAGPLQILGKPIEVKRAQPRGNMREEEDNKKFGRNKFGNRDNNNNNSGGGYDGGQNNANMQQGQGGNPQMTPAMLAQYWQRMQQYFRQMQEGIAAGGMANSMGGMPPGMNPAMMGMMGGMNPGAGQGPMGGAGMNPMMAAQFQNMQGGGGPGGPGGYGGGPDPNGRPNIFNPQDQLAFEQQKYEQQQQRRMQQSAGYQGAGGPTSWEGMYDEIPQPSNLPSGPGAQRMHGGGSNYGGHGKHGRGRQGSSQPPANAPNAPANAPTGPKNAGKPGANYRGGGRGGNYRHNPYGGRG